MDRWSLCQLHSVTFAERNLGGWGVCATEATSCGIRDAPREGKPFLAKQVKSMKFVSGLVSPWRYRHSSKDLSCVAHGDDFVFVGVETDLE